ncbi:hypothetical protein [Streptomyces cinnamoneus]|uniref:hypothetical protein n=1 Tax=Streptomyces cinnamoneus TaxID=53446 RepID=UPI00378B9E94
MSRTARRDGGHQPAAVLPASASSASPAVEPDGRALSAVLPAVSATRDPRPVPWRSADVAAGRLDAFGQYGRADADLLAGALIAP